MIGSTASSVHVVFHGEHAPLRHRIKGPLAGCTVREPHPWRYCRACKNSYMRQKRAEGKWRQIYNEKVLARARVNTRIRRGQMFKQPCEVCGEIKVQAHHTDYGKPLEVRWLCKVHHRAADVASGIALGGRKTKGPRNGDSASASFGN